MGRVIIPVFLFLSLLLSFVVRTQTQVCSQRYRITAYTLEKKHYSKSKREGELGAYTSSAERRVNLLSTCPDRAPSPYALV